MKTFVAFATATLMLSGIASTTSATAVERQLIMGGEIVPIGIKTYTTSLRTTPDGRNWCGGSLISPTHVLSASHCLKYGIRYASIGTHYSNGTEDGEQIRVISIMAHPNYSENVNNADDFMVLELEKPSSFQPVKLAAADDSDFEVGKWATTMGWGTNGGTEGNHTYPYELQRVDIQLVSDEACANYVSADPSMMCAGGVLGKDSCWGDSGGPLIVSSTTEGNTTEDVLIGVVSWKKDATCAQEGDYGIYSRVSSVRPWIDSITGSSGTCLSA